MKKFSYLCVMLNLFFFVGHAPMFEAGAAEPVKLKIYTEDHPPLNFTEKGKITGLATEVVQELMKRTATRGDIQVVPWEEGYKNALEKPNVALFSVVMTSARKPLLQWVGPIVFLDTDFYAKKGSGLEIEFLEDAKKVPKIVVVKDKYAEQLLKKDAFSNLESVATEEDAIRKLLSGDAQLFPSTNVEMPDMLKRVDAKMDAVENALNLSTNLVYIGFSK